METNADYTRRIAALLSLDLAAVEAILAQQAEASQAQPSPWEAADYAEPPFSNTGVRIENDLSTRTPAPSQTSQEAGVFDWYQASIPAHTDAIQTAFVAAFGGTFEACHPINGYENGAKHTAYGVSIFWGGKNPHPNLKATSRDAIPVAEWLRDTYPAHRVSRADVAFDFSFEGAFDMLTSSIDERARKVGATCMFIGDVAENSPDFAGERKGRTWYYGSKFSDVSIRVYEKGFEQRGKGVAGTDPNWVRVEVVIKPKKDRKAQAAHLSPFAMVGFSKWVSNAVGDILADTPTILPNEAKRMKPRDHALAHMATQYSKHLRSYIEEHGAVELLGFLYVSIYEPKERAKMGEVAAVPAPFQPKGAAQ